MTAVVVCGTLGRSGTNFLRDLLVLHPDCRPPQQVPEDFLLHHADHLIAYADEVTAHWSDRDAADPLLRALGEAALHEVARRADRQRLVTKTPSVRNLEHFDRVFPGAHLVVIVRDGRSVAESYVRSFGANYEGVMHRWAEAARTVLDVAGGRPADRPLQVVQFESLSADVEAALRPLLVAVDLDPDRYDFDAARALPVRGSSEGTQTEEGLHWRPVEPGEAFDPTSRWSSWDQRRHDRFNWIAGDEMTALGYELVGPDHSGSRPLRHRVLDAGWTAADRLKLVPAARSLVRRLRLQGRF